jgi:hypothetical protein
LPAGYAAQINFNTIHSGVFVDLRQQITGIDGLIPDPALDNGGLHESQTGGKFAMHIDFNQHFVTKLDARLVFITYLNKDWLPSYGGALELWSADEGKCKVEIEPASAGQSSVLKPANACMVVQNRSMPRGDGRGAPPPHISTAMAIRKVKVKAHSLSARSFPWPSQKPGVGGP